MTLYLDICLRVKRWGRLRAYAEAQGLEVETYGETQYLVQTLEKRNGITVARTKVRTRARTDYVTVRNVSEEDLSELRRFGRLLRGYPMRPREFYPQVELRRPEPEKPTCPICQTDRNVHWVGRDHWTCQVNHFPQHFGALRLT